MRSPSCLATTILIACFAVYVARIAIVGAREVFRTNDFEVFYNVGAVAADHLPTIYDVVSPIKKRGPFLYPPSAAVLFIPLTWVSQTIAGAIMTAIKLGCFVLLLWGSVRWSGAAWLHVSTVWLAMLVALVVVHRAIDSDFGNGQVNIIVAGAAVGGVWLMMLSARWWWSWAGCVLLAWAVAVKLTPALLIAVPLLHGKWKPLVLTIAAGVLLYVALPAAWFGPKQFQNLLRQHAQITNRFALDWPALNRQITLLEVFQFTRVQANPSLPHQSSAAENTDTLPTITGKSGANLLAPALRAWTIRVWIGSGLAVGLVFLAGRWALFRGRFADWTWDLAMLCALIVLLSPRAHKAHLAILIVPAGWLAARAFQRLFRAGSPAATRSSFGPLIALASMSLMFLIVENLPLPGPFDAPYRCLGFIGLLTMIGMLVWLKASEPASLLTQPELVNQRRLEYVHNHAHLSLGQQRRPDAAGIEGHH
jgi:hypothetical protein